jgi:hypothetical protein
MQFMSNVRPVVTVIALIAALVLPNWLHSRRWNGFPAILGPAALVPLAITFESFVYPAEPEFRVWWHIAVLTGAFVGLVAAGLSYAAAAYEK